MSLVDDAIVWIDQARSDARMAEHVATAGPAILRGDIGCHVALLCAQSFEKCIKGCMFLVGQIPTLTHDVEPAIERVLGQARLRRDARKRLPEVDGQFDSDSGRVDVATAEQVARQMNGWMYQADLYLRRQGM